MSAAQEYSEVCNNLRLVSQLLSNGLPTCKDEADKLHAEAQRLALLPPSQKYGRYRFGAVYIAFEGLNAYALACRLAHADLCRAGIDERGNIYESCAILVDSMRILEDACTRTDADEVAYVTMVGSQEEQQAHDEHVMGSLRNSIKDVQREHVYGDRFRSHRSFARQSCSLAGWIALSAKFASEHTCIELAAKPYLLFETTTLYFENTISAYDHFLLTLDAVGEKGLAPALIDLFNALHCDVTCDIICRLTAFVFSGVEVFPKAKHSLAEAYVCLAPRHRDNVHIFLIKNAHVADIKLIASCLERLLRFRLKTIPSMSQSLMLDLINRSRTGVSSSANTPSPAVVTPAASRRPGN